MDEEIINKILEEVAFEKEFYEIVANTKNYDVIPIEAVGQSPRYVRDEIERKAIEAQCEQAGMKILYRISYGSYAVVVSKDGEDLIGIVPENNSDGWPC